MRIFYLITKSEAGGAQTHIWQLSRYFIAKGNNEVAVMSCPGGWLQGELKKMGVKFYPNTFFSNSLNPVRGFLAIKEIKKALADFKPDLISCHSSAAGFWGRTVIRNKIPTLFTAHGWAFTEGVPIWRKYLAILAERLASKYCSRIICVSDFDRLLALKYGIAQKEKFVVVHNGVEIEPLAESKSFKEPFKIVFLGRLAAPKDPLLLLKAFLEFDQDLKEKLELLIIGDGPQKKNIEEFISNNALQGLVKVLGRVDRKNIFEILKKSHIFVLISNWEGFPRTVLEAMSCGLPVIASNVGGIKEAVNGDCGILVQRGNKQEIKNALEKLIKNLALSREMGRNARLRVEQEFSLDKMLKETAEVYRKITFLNSNNQSSKLR